MNINWNNNKEAFIWPGQNGKWYDKPGNLYLGIDYLTQRLSITVKSSWVTIVVQKITLTIKENQNTKSTSKCKDKQKVKLEKQIEHFIAPSGECIVCYSSGILSQDNLKVLIGHWTDRSITELQLTEKFFFVFVFVVLFNFIWVWISFEFNFLFGKVFEIVAVCLTGKLVPW